MKKMSTYFKWLFILALIGGVFLIALNFFKSWLESGGDINFVIGQLRNIKNISSFIQAAVLIVIWINWESIIVKKSAKSAQPALIRSKNTIIGFMFVLLIFFSLI